MQDWEWFLRTIKELKSYLIEFEKDSIIKTKNYLANYKIESNKYWPIIVIIYDKYIFSSNNGIYKV